MVCLMDTQAHIIQELMIWERVVRCLVIPRVSVWEILFHLSFILDLSFIMECLSSNQNDWLELTVV